MRKILVADSSTAEFGWELMSWQGYVRKQARAFDKVIVCTTAGLEPVYEDFADDFIVHRISMVRDCAKAREIHNTGAWNKYRAEIAVRIREEQRGSNITILKFTKYVAPEKQSFICYGDATRAHVKGDAFDLLIHARNKYSHNSYYNVYNWPVERWDDVLGDMSKDLRIGAVGTTSDALLPKHAEDFRGVDLRRLMDAMSASRLIAGPSSGPMHLAALCGLPRLVWASPKWSSSTKMNDQVRYAQRWNPFGTPCIVTENTDPDASTMIRDLGAALNGKERILKPGAAAATQMASYWSARRKRQGRAYVSREGKNSDHQVSKLAPVLHQFLKGRQYKHGLDFGCGWGRFSGVISEYCERLRCVDLVSDFRDDLPDSVQFEKIGFPTKIGVPDGSIDLFVAVTSLQHIVDEHWFTEVAAELRRVLAPTAMVYIVDDNGRAGKYVKQRTAAVFAKALNLSDVIDGTFDMDSRRSHHIVTGVHCK
jgi:hypothetical protein